MFDVFKNTDNADFFNILARPNKELYWTIINHLYDEVMSVYERRISRSEARFLIEKILSKYKTKKDECSMEPYAFINSFIDTGWLVQRYDGEEGDDLLFFTPFAINFLKSMEDYDNNGGLIQTEDYLKRIYSIADDIIERKEDSDAYKYPFRNGITKIITLLGDCFYQLSNIQYQTNEDIKIILDTKDLQELIDKLTIYIDDLNGGYIHNVYESFNLTELYRKKVTELIEAIEIDKNLRTKVLLDMKERYKNSPIQKTDEELEQSLSLMLTTLENKIKVAYPSYKEKIDKNIQNVISKSLHKMNLLSEGGASHLATLNRVIELMSFIAERNDEHLYENDEHAIGLLNNSININKTKVVSQESLFKKREFAQKEQMEPVEILETDEEVDLAKLETEHFTLEESNQYARKFLKNMSEVKASSLDFDNEETVVKLQAICLLSDDKDAEYEIVFTGERVYCGEYEFDDFVIKKI